MEPTKRAVSICVYDPTGTQTLETYPPDSTWYWKDGSKARKRRKDVGIARTSETPLDNPILGIDN